MAVTDLANTEGRLRGGGGDLPGRSGALASGAHHRAAGHSGSTPDILIVVSTTCGTVTFYLKGVLRWGVLRF